MAFSRRTCSPCFGTSSAAFYREQVRRLNERWQKRRIMDMISHNCLAFIGRAIARRLDDRRGVAGSSQDANLGDRTIVRGRSSCAAAGRGLVARSFFEASAGFATDIVAQQNRSRSTIVGDEGIQRRIPQVNAGDSGLLRGRSIAAGCQTRSSAGFSRKHHRQSCEESRGRAVGSHCLAGGRNDRGDGPSAERGTEPDADRREQVSCRGEARCQAGADIRRLPSPRLLG